MTAPTYADLLTRYLSDRDETAFAAIVRKHGPMVFGACRRITAHHHDAEDAFQAAFLVLAVRADAVRPASRLGAWLHGVAVRCARKAHDARRRTAPNEPLIEPTILPPAVEPDLPPLIDDALAAIPDAYRAAVVLCHLQGRSRIEAARELGWSEGTLSGRLHRALDLLGRRLAARGVTATGAAVLAVLSARTASASVPSALSGSTQTAASLLSSGFDQPAGSATALAHGVMRAMSFRKLKLAVAVLVGVFGAGSFAALNSAEAKPADRQRVVRRNAPVPAEKKQTWKELFAVKHETEVSAVAISDEILATAGHPGDRSCNLKLWKPKDGEPLGLEVRGAWYKDAPNVLRFVSGGKYLMLTTVKGCINRYEQRAGGMVADAYGTPEVLGFSDDLSVLAIRDAKQPLTAVNIHPNLWTVKVARPQFTLEHQQLHAVTHATLSPDGTRLMLAHADSVIRVSGPLTKELKEVYTINLPPKTTVTELKLSDDGKRLAVIGEKGFAKVFDADNGAELCELKGHDGTVNAAAFTPDGSQLATANGKVVRVFDAKSGKLLGEIKGHDDEVTCLAFAADGKRLVTWSKDRTAKVWEVK
ncbi:MAG: sigma-70 family RNA polymerase sigma factor [Gemmataceae bacterium]